MRLLQLTIILSFLSLSSFQTSAEANKKYKVSSLSNVSDLNITLKISYDSDGVATVSKTSKPAKAKHQSSMNFIGFKAKFTAGAIQLPENTEERKMFVVDIDLLHPPRLLDNATLSGGWVYIYARSVKYLN